MPTVLYRAMLPDADGAPQVGSGRNMLGVRPDRDIRSGVAGPGRGGMSVSIDTTQHMNVAIRPKDFGGFNGETVMYDLPASKVLDHPALKLGDPDKRMHAVIEAREECAVSFFQAQLEGTRPDWHPTAPPQPERPGGRS